MLTGCRTCSTTAAVGDAFRLRQLDRRLRPDRTASGSTRARRPVPSTNQARSAWRPRSVSAWAKLRGDRPGDHLAVRGSVRAGPDRAPLGPRARRADPRRSREVSQPDPHRRRRPGGRGRARSRRKPNPSIWSATTGRSPAASITPGWRILLGAAEPRFRPSAAGSPEAARDATSKRVINHADETATWALTLIYPDITTGLPAAVLDPLDAAQQVTSTAAARIDISARAPARRSSGAGPWRSAFAGRARRR